MCLTKYSYVITSYTEAHSYTPTAHELLAEIHSKLLYRLSGMWNVDLFMVNKCYNCYIRFSSYHVYHMLYSLVQTGTSTSVNFSFVRYHLCMSKHV